MKQPTMSIVYEPTCCPQCGSPFDPAQRRYFVRVLRTADQKWTATGQRLRQFPELF